MWRTIVDEHAEICSSYLRVIMNEARSRVCSVASIDDPSWFLFCHISEVPLLSTGLLGQKLLQAKRGWCIYVPVSSRGRLKTISFSASSMRCKIWTRLLSLPSSQQHLSQLPSPCVDDDSLVPIVLPSPPPHSLSAVPGIYLRGGSYSTWHFQCSGPRAQFRSPLPHRLLSCFKGACCLHKNMLALVAKPVLSHLVLSACSSSSWVFSRPTPGQLLLWWRKIEDDTFMFFLERCCIKQVC